MQFVAKLTKPDCRDCYIIERRREYDLTGKKENATVFDCDNESNSALNLISYLEAQLDNFYYNRQYGQQGESTAKAAKEFYLLFRTYKLELEKIEERQNETI